MLLNASAHWRAPGNGEYSQLYDLHNPVARNWSEGRQSDQPRSAAGLCSSCRPGDWGDLKRQANMGLIIRLRESGHGR
jgi:hypothetical protein